MTPDQPPETIREATVSYTIEIDGRWIIVEHVPARIVQETGEVLFSPQTVEKLQKVVRANPSRMIQTPVFDFAA